MSHSEERLVFKLCLSDMEVPNLQLFNVYQDGPIARLFR